MSRLTGASLFLRAGVAAFVALLLAVPAFAALLPVKTPACCLPARPAMGCCAEEGVSGASVSCCLIFSPGEATPSLQASASVLDVSPAARPAEPPLSVTASLAGPRHVSPRARSAPLFLLNATLLV